MPGRRGSAAAGRGDTEGWGPSPASGCWGHLPSRGPRRDLPRLNIIPLQVERGGQRSGSRQSRCHFQCLSSVIMLASSSLLFPPLFFSPFPLQVTMWTVPGHSGEVQRAGAGAIPLRRLTGRKNAVQIREASAIKWRVWAAAVEAHTGGSAEGARQGANPIVRGTQAASEAPGDISEATVPRTMESGQLPHG